MSSSGMLRLVALVGTDVSEELSACIIRVTIVSQENVTVLPLELCRWNVLLCYPQNCVARTCYPLNCVAGT
jgi:hypothetical protein